MGYRGRFAPSPTGPLHFGSLVTALASYLDTRANRGEWLVRVEDLDPLRETREAADRILKSLECHGLHPDQPVLYQSERHELYRRNLATLEELGFAYSCPCSRRELHSNDGLHPRHCRQSPIRGTEVPAAVRFALATRSWSWNDLLLGHQTRNTRAELDDFVLQRKEGFFAYQLAVVSDDIDQGITHAVRGSDLLDSTPFQLALYEAFSRTPPAFMHLPLITDDKGHKLSKQTFAPALDDSCPEINLAAAFAALNHPLPGQMQAASPEAQLKWGQVHWRREQLPTVLSISRSTLASAPHR